MKASRLNWWQRALGLALALAMVMGSLPAQALADAADKTGEEGLEEVVVLAADEVTDDEKAPVEAVVDEPVDEGEASVSEDAADLPADAAEGEQAVVEVLVSEDEVLAPEEEAVPDADIAPEEPAEAVEEPELTSQAERTYRLTLADVASIGTQRWTSKAIMPKPKVTYDGKALVLNRDYTLSYKNNVKPGTATIVIKGTGSFVGTKTVTFAIKKIGTWKKYADGWRYVWAPGQYPKSQFLTIDGKSYRFDKYGIMLTGWKKLTVSGKTSWYYFGSDGARRTGWYRISGSWYWFAKYGRMATGPKTISGKTYYFGSNGAMRTGWQKISKKWYYFESSGAMVKNRWVGNYYLGKTGAMLTNTVTPDGYRVLANGCWDGKGKVPTKVKTKAFSVAFPSYWLGKVSTDTWTSGSWQYSGVNLSGATSGSVVHFRYIKNSAYKDEKLGGGSFRIATKKGATYTVEVWMTAWPWEDYVQYTDVKTQAEAKSLIKALTGGKYKEASSTSWDYARQYVEKNIVDKLVVY